MRTRTNWPTNQNNSSTRLTPSWLGNLGVRTGKKAAGESVTYSVTPVGFRVWRFGWVLLLPAFLPQPETSNYLRRQSNGEREEGKAAWISHYYSESELISRRRGIKRRRKKRCRNRKFMSEIIRIHISEIFISLWRNEPIIRWSVHTPLFGRWFAFGPSNSDCWQKSTRGKPARESSF